MKNSNYQLTFAVEVGLVLVFHEKLIVAELLQGKGKPRKINNKFRDGRMHERELNALIQKDISDVDRKEMSAFPDHHQQSRPRYLAWGIVVDQGESPERQSRYSLDKQLRTYEYEHLHLAKEALRSRAQNDALNYWDNAIVSDVIIDVHTGLLKPIDYKTWHLIREADIEALAKNELQSYLSRNKVCSTRDSVPTTQGKRKQSSSNESGHEGSAPKRAKATQAVKVPTLARENATLCSSDNDSDQDNEPPQVTVADDRTPLKATDTLAVQRSQLRESNVPLLTSPRVLPGNRAGLGSEDNVTHVESESPIIPCAPMVATRIYQMDQQSLPQTQQSPTTARPKQRPQPASRSSLVSFYDGAADNRGRTLLDILAWDDDKLDADGEYIQLLFPLPENRSAPPLDEPTVRVIQTNPRLRTQVLRCFSRMLTFFGFEMTATYEKCRLKRGANFGEARKRWVKFWGVNHEKIARIIRSLRIFGYEDMAIEFYNAVREVYDEGNISERSMRLWTETVLSPIEMGCGNSSLEESHPILDSSEMRHGLSAPTGVNGFPSSTRVAQHSTGLGASSPAAVRSRYANPHVLSEVPINAQNLKSPPQQAKQSVPKPIPPKANEWDSQGIELVSRALRLTTSEAEFGEITDLCNRLKGQPCHLHGATASPTTGLRVHLEAFKDELGHRTLQHLLYILIMYEFHIDTLHPAHRRVESPSPSDLKEVNSNCGFFLQDEDMPLKDVRQKIFGDPNQASEQLLPLTGNRNRRAVSLTCLRPHEEHSCMLEFRQHEGVLRGEMIKYWVLFCAGLVRLANSMAHELAADEAIRGTADSRGYPFRDWNDSMSLFDLLDAMELEPDARSYFVRRAAYFAPMSAPGPPSGECYYDSGQDFMDRWAYRYEIAGRRSSWDVRSDSES